MTNEEQNKCAEEIAVILDKYLSGGLDLHPVQDLEVINNCIEHYVKASKAEGGASIEPLTLDGKTVLDNQLPDGYTPPIAKGEVEDA